MIRQHVRLNVGIFDVDVVVNAVSFFSFVWALVKKCAKTFETKSAKNKIFTDNNNITNKIKNVLN